MLNIYFFILGEGDVAISNSSKHTSIKKNTIKKHNIYRLSEQINKLLGELLMNDLPMTYYGLEKRDFPDALA